MYIKFKKFAKTSLRFGIIIRYIKSIRFYMSLFFGREEGGFWNFLKFISYLPNRLSSYHSFLATCERNIVIFKLGGYKKCCTLLQMTKTRMMVKIFIHFSKLDFLDLKRNNKIWKTSTLICPSSAEYLNEFTQLGTFKSIEKMK